MTNIAGFDSNSRSLMELDYQILNGNLWVVTTTITDIPNGAFRNLLVRVSDIPLILNILVEITGRIRANVIEGVSVILEGKEIDPVNRNRVKVANRNIQSTFFQGPNTITSGGTGLIPGGVILQPNSSPRALCGEAPSGINWVFASNTDYVVRIFNEAGVNVDVTLFLLMVERKISDR